MYHGRFKKSHYEAGDNWVSVVMQLAENADTIYSAHGRPFPKCDLAKYKKYISKIHLHKLK